MLPSSVFRSLSRRLFKHESRQQSPLPDPPPLPSPNRPVLLYPSPLPKMGALRRKAEEDVAQVSQRLRQSEQRREELTDLKFAHEAELRELRGRSEAGEAGREAATSDAKALRESNRALEARAFEAEREADRLRLHGAALAQQVWVRFARVVGRVFSKCTRACGCPVDVCCSRIAAENSHFQSLHASLQALRTRLDAVCLPQQQPVAILWQPGTGHWYGRLLWVRVTSSQVVLSQPYSILRDPPHTPLLYLIIPHPLSHST